MTIDTRIAPVKPPLDGYYSRIIAYLCAALTFSALLIENGHRLCYLVAILYSLAYPQLAQYLPTRLPRLPHLPQRLSLVALGSPSFRRRVRPDGCVGRLRSRPGGLDAIR